MFSRCGQCCVIYQHVTINTYIFSRVMIDKETKKNRSQDNLVVHRTLLTLWRSKSHEVRLSLARAATSIIFCRGKRVCLPRQNVCRDKIMFAATQIFVATKYICRDKVLSRKLFAVTNIRLSRHNFAFVTASIRVCRDKTNLIIYTIMFVATNTSCDKTFLSRQACLSHDKRRVLFVATSTCLSRQKWYLWQLPPMTGR